MCSHCTKTASVDFFHFEKCVAIFLRFEFKVISHSFEIQVLFYPHANWINSTTNQRE